METPLGPFGLSASPGVHVVPFNALEATLRAWHSFNGQLKALGSSILSTCAAVRGRDNDDICLKGPVREGAGLFAPIRGAGYGRH